MFYSKEWGFYFLSPYLSIALKIDKLGCSLKFVACYKIYSPRVSGAGDVCVCVWGGIKNFYFMQSYALLSNCSKVINIKACLNRFYLQTLWCYFQFLIEIIVVLITYFCTKKCIYSLFSEVTFSKCVEFQKTKVSILKNPNIIICFQIQLWC